MSEYPLGLWKRQLLLCKTFLQAAELALSTSSSTNDILHHSGTFITIGELTLTHHYHPKSMVYMRVYFWCAFYSFWHMCNSTQLLGLPHAE